MGEQAQTIVVDMMWGVEGINKTNVDFFNASDIGTTIWDNEFDMSSREAQQQIYDFCQHLKSLKDLLYQEKSVSCWIDDFKSWLDSKNERFPIDENRFPDLLLQFSTEDEKGKFHREQTNIGFIDDKLVFMRFSAKSRGDPFAPYAVKNPIRQEWEE